MFVTIKRFLTGQSGSVTTDWVVLVASLVVMAVVVLTAVTGGAVNLTNQTATTLAAMTAG